jgi:hypothetical protein
MNSQRIWIDTSEKEVTSFGLSVIHLLLGRWAKQSGAPASPLGHKNTDKRAPHLGAVLAPPPPHTPPNHSLTLDVFPRLYS